MTLPELREWAKVWSRILPKDMGDPVINHRLRKARRLIDPLLKNRPMSQAEAQRRAHGAYRTVYPEENT